MPHPLRKRLLRISLRMVFVLTTILCIWLGFKVHQVKQQREAVAWVEAHGGMVAYQHEKIPHGPKWLRDLFGVDYFVKPFRVTLDSDHPESFSQLAKLPELTEVEVSSKSVRDVSPLAELRDLEYLALNCDEVRDFCPLKTLENLRLIYLPRSATEEDIASLHKAIPGCMIYRYESVGVRCISDGRSASE